jgi:plastocyanin
MKLGFWMIFLLIPLVGAILAMIAAAPEDIPQPDIQSEMVTEKSTETISEPPPSLAVPAPEAENVPEMIVEEELEKMIEKPEPTASFQVEVNIPTGSGIVGCELTMECYIPSTVTVSVGGIVIWFNDDTVPHTVTSGSMSDGHDAKFDSGLFMADSTFSRTFDEEGVYDYFCIVHPWMAGTVQVS